MLEEALRAIQFQKISRLEGKSAINLSNGWVYSLNFRHFQKVKGAVYVYVTPQYGRWIVQAYKRKTTDMCSLEARVTDLEKVDKLFELGDKWLEKYQYSLEDVKQDPFSPWYAGGWKGENITDTIEDVLSCI